MYQTIRGTPDPGLTVLDGNSRNRCLRHPLSLLNSRSMPPKSSPLTSYIRFVVRWWKWLNQCAIHHATRYVTPLRDCKAETTAAFFYRTLNIVTCSSRLDQRLWSFDLANVVEAFLHACNVVYSPTTGYDPQTNTLADHLNHTFVKMITTYVSHKHSNWYTVLPL